MSASSARLRALAGALCLLSALQAGAGALGGALASPSRSCVVPMPCCDKGFCPLHARGASRHEDGPRWLRCDDETPLARPPATADLAVLGRGEAAPFLPFFQRLAKRPAFIPPSLPREPELHPPRSPAAS